jgi:hypothetical protein
MFQMLLFSANDYETKLSLPLNVDQVNKMADLTIPLRGGGLGTAKLMTFFQSHICR